MTPTGRGFDLMYGKAKANKTFCDKKDTHHNTQDAKGRSYGGSYRFTTNGRKTY
jgi:hypothetical protein